ncbi:homocysteine biosynthesis protein [Desulfolucanica intricata]|uniref:homocysteine biosynthesis protein n=1 Tax=Desulfolucanica intricata TaxID=1285191 RepID=UPI00082A16F1|nr:homocysteine biosynthesis protein [Desulfolucanica intricata]
MSIERTYAEINSKIKSGKVVVVTAEELVTMVKDKGITAAAKEVDVVTTGTFGPMCSSGVFLNFGHSAPRMKIQKAWLNKVPAYGGIAAADVFLGATEMPEDDPLNSSYPGEFRYGGGHVIEDLVARKPIKYKAIAYGTDCYPRKEIETEITLDDINEAILMNPRNAYQNYNCAVNLSSRTIYTYMGLLKPNLGNAHYSTAGQLSPLLKDPDFRTIGVGTRIFLGGGIGYVVWNGTQHFPDRLYDKNGKYLGPSGGTLSVLGDLKQMNPQWLRGTSFLGYGATLTVGIGVPIPVLNEEIIRYAAVPDEELYAPIMDYSDAYPNRKPCDLGFVSYAELKSGKITVNGKEIPTASMSSYKKAREVAGILKQWIQKGDFLLSQPAQLLPNADDGIKAKVLKG